MACRSHDGVRIGDGGCWQAATALDGRTPGRCKQRPANSPYRLSARSSTHQTVVAGRGRLGGDDWDGPMHEMWWQCPGHGSLRLASARPRGPNTRWQSPASHPQAPLFVLDARAPATDSIKRLPPRPRLTLVTPRLPLDLHYHLPIAYACLPPPGSSPSLHSIPFPCLSRNLILFFSSSFPDQLASSLPSPRPTTRSVLGSAYLPVAGPSGQTRPSQGLRVCLRIRVHAFGLPPALRRPRTLPTRTSKFYFRTVSRLFIFITSTHYFNRLLYTSNFTTTIRQHVLATPPPACRGRLRLLRNPGFVVGPQQAQH